MEGGDIDPDHFDLIVLGTGLPESILAAAAASSGRKVLHLDSEEFYGSEWATMSLDQLTTFVKSLGASNGAVDSSSVDRSNELLELGLIEAEVRRDEFLYSAGEVCEYEASQLGSSRSYCLDLAAPKIILCAEPLVDLLVECGASNYLELKDVRATFIWTGSQFTTAPTSSSELFQDNMTVLDKRRLMRFLKAVQRYASGEAGFSDESMSLTFVEFLKAQHLPASIQSQILYAVALLEEDQEKASAPLPALEGLQRLKLHLSSIGRFGNNGAFLCTLYGQGEIPQAFCRVAAVKGTLYVLRRPVSSLLLDKETKQYKGVRTKSGQLLYSDKLVLGAAYNKPGRELRASSEESDGETSSSQVLGRSICITDDSLHLAHSNLLVIFPPRSIDDSNLSVVRVLQLGSTAVCPNGKYVIQISSVCASVAAAKSIMQRVQNILFFLPGIEADATSILQPETCKPRLLWSTFFAEELHSTEPQVFENQIGVCSQPGSEPGYQGVIASAEKVLELVLATCWWTNAILQVFHELFGPEQWFSEQNITNNN